MQELRFVAVSEDGSYAVLAVPGRSGRYILPIDERLRAVAQGQTSRLAQYEIEVESPLRPKEIQARIRAGETAEEIADAAGIPVERVRWFEGPVLAERAYIADQAQAGSVRRAGDSSGPGPRLGDIVTARLSAAGTEPADGQWDSRKRGDGNWQVSLTFPSGGRLHVAEWVFDPRRRHVMPDDDNAARLSLPESELPAEPEPVPGEATVTPIASRLGAAAGMGGGSVGGPGVSRFRPDRSVIPDRSLGVERSLADRPVPPPERTPMPERPGPAERTAMADRYAAPERPQAQQERPGYQGRPVNPGYAEFPESAPYRAPEPAAEPPAYRDQAQEPAEYAEACPRGYSDPASVSSAYRAQVTEPPAYREAPPLPPSTYRDPAPEAAPYRAPVTPPPAQPDQAYQPAPRDQEYRPAAYRAPAADLSPSAQVPAADALPPAQAPAVQVSPAAFTQDAERVRPAPPRPVIFEDAEPAFPDEQAELPQEFTPARPAAPVSDAPVPVAAEPARAQEPAVTPPAVQAPAVAAPPTAAPASAPPPVAAPAVAAQAVPVSPVAVPPLAGPALATRRLSQGQGRRRPLARRRLPRPRSRRK